MTAGGREFLLKEGTDLKYGARHLKRAIERHVVYPMANLLATEQIHLGDMLSIDWDHSQDHLAFTREAEGVLVPVKTLEPAVAVRAAQAKGGRFVEAPAAAPAPAKEAGTPAAPSTRLLR